MANRIKTQLLPSQEKLLNGLCKQIRYARLRRNIPAEQLAQRAGIARTTIMRFEHGDSGTTISTLIKILFVLGLEQDVLHLAKDSLMDSRMQSLGIEKQTWNRNGE